MSSKSRYYPNENANRRLTEQEVDALLNDPRYMNEFAMLVQKLMDEYEASDGLVPKATIRFDGDHPRLEKVTMRKM